MLELHVRKLLRDLQRRVHEAKGRREDEAGALTRQTLDGAFRVGAFRHALDVDGLDLVAEFLLDGETALVVLVGPAIVADRTDVDEADLELVGRIGVRHAETEQRGGREAEQFLH